ncbi:hypothetical protein NESM_000090500 [Novymonas esmeraldas]|uniref:Uncharacterized protein n=1 Tax=Novymonas esmeraldas TaxID=1808958 RepID=A0AAW0F1A3_9TRYP
MFGGPFRPRVVPAADGRGAHPALQPIADGTCDGPQATSSSPPPPPRGIPWNRLYSSCVVDTDGTAAHRPNAPAAVGTTLMSSSSSLLPLDPASPLSTAADTSRTYRLPAGRATAGTYSSPLGHRYHADEVPPPSPARGQQQQQQQQQQDGEGGPGSSATAAAAAPTSAAVHRYQQLAAQHRYGTAAFDCAAAVVAPPAAAPQTGGVVPPSILKHADPQPRRVSNDGDGDGGIAAAAHVGRGTGVAAGTATGHRPAETAEPHIRSIYLSSSAPATAATAAAAAAAALVAVASETQAERRDSEPPSTTMRRSAATRRASQRSPTRSRSSSAAPPRSRRAAALAAEDTLSRSSRGSAAQPAQQQQQQQQQLYRPSRSSTSHRAAPAMSAAGQRPSPPRTAQWAVKLIDELVAQVAVQQEAAVAAPTVVSSSGAAAAHGRRAASGAATTVADLTAAFLSSRYGALHWRPMLHEFAACLHRYRRVSPACAVFRAHFIHVGADSLSHFHLLCRLYAAGDLQHGSSVECRRVAVAPATHTIVSRRYVDTREVADRLHRMLRQLVLLDSARWLVVGDAEGDAVDRVAAAAVSTSRQRSGRVQYREARDPLTRTASVPHRRRLTAEEVTQVKRRVLAWVEESSSDAMGREHSDDSGGSGTDNDDAAAETAALQRVSFDREGRVDAYALLQATLEALLLVCSTAPTPPGEGDDEVGSATEVPSRANHRHHRHPQPWQSGHSTNGRAPQRVAAVLTPPRSYAYPLESDRDSGSGGVVVASSQYNGGHGNRDGVGAAWPSRDASFAQPRASASATGAVAARVAADGRLWSPPRDAVLLQQRRRGRGGGGGHRVSPMRHRVSVAADSPVSPHSPRRPVNRLTDAEVMEVVEEHGSPHSRGGGEGHDGGGGGGSGRARRRSSHVESDLVALEKPFEHHPYVAQLHGSELWAAAQAGAAAVAQRRDSCWRDHYPRTFTQEHMTPSPRQHPWGAPSPHTTSAASLSASPADTTTIDAIDAELRRRHHRHACAGPPPTNTTVDSAAAASDVHFFINPDESHLGHLSAAARMLGRPRAAPSPHTVPAAAPAIWVERVTPARTGASAVPLAKDTVVLTEEEQAMLNQLESALHRLDAQHRRSHAAAAGEAHA